MQQFTAKEYLKIDIANSFGLDKENWDNRISWFNNNEHKLNDLVKEADSPALFFAGIQAYKEVQMGKPIGYPISLDATASGIQLLSILIKCRKSASTCNVINHDSGNRQDVYTVNYQTMCNKMGDVARIDRSQTKQALMTAVYNSVAVPRETFGEGSELLACFYETVKEELPGAWALNEAMLGTWRPNNLSHDWVMPDGFNVHIKVMGVKETNVHMFNQPHTIRYAVNEPTEEGRSNGANMTHSVDALVVREMTARCMHDPETVRKLKLSLGHTGKSQKREQDAMVMRLWSLYEQSGFLSSRILSYLDSMNMGLIDSNKIKDMLDTLPEKPFNILSVHDCFRVHPNYGNDLRKQYNQILHEIAKSNLLTFIVSQIVGYNINIPQGDDFADEILKANYALS